ncbi:extracellular solute-binding protein [Corallococcus aberystwythensis]|uniref:Extracellular solute-binding protein n=1 Tax=Corallococcus aberystwythensis TaxID=2316722 RepID=A0A3A8R6G9_9BACT|nr:extracellular solute-binding protein [Corallococcus aberystwythensis]RKH74770.1 extracellular solute-binding protein [Corallococcus aberystwythensis]
MRWSALICPAVLVLSACSESSDPDPTPKRPLKAVLFPYIPDSAGDGFASLEQRLEADFERAHPDIDLDVVFDANLDVYDLDEGGTLNQLLGTDASAAQVVEVDTLVLGSLAEKGWIQPVALEAGVAHPAAEEAVRISGQSYGVPTYLCTKVIYSRTPNIRSATDSTSLARILREAAPGKRPLVANFDGSWTLPASYLDAWLDTHPGDALASAISLPLDSPTVGAFAEVVDSCSIEAGVNPCLDGSYADNTVAEEAFATGQANGFMGYTERLFYILQAQPSMPLPEVISVPLGAGSAPAVFVDALVLNKNCAGTCAEDARAFTSFMQAPETRSLIAFSKDAPDGTRPRYLLQANRAFYQQEPARSDPMYQQYEPILSGARPYPNQRFPENRKALQAALLEDLQ